MNRENRIIIRELREIEDLRRCTELQREAFHLPDLELSPLRHFVVVINCGGFVLGAFAVENNAEKLVGFVLHQTAVRENEIIGYSHMMAVAQDFQNQGIGAQLKWAQRAKALALKQKFVKWTFDPMQSRNAHFNLNRLGATIRRYAPNFYGTNYVLLPDQFDAPSDLDSDRLIAEWQLEDQTVIKLASGEKSQSSVAPVGAVEIPKNWREIVELKPQLARQEQLRVRQEFQAAFAENLVCAGFETNEKTSKYLFYES